MITIDFIGSEIPSLQEQDEKRKNLLDWLGVFKDEADKFEMTFLFNCPPINKDEEVTFTYNNGEPTFDFVRRFNHYYKTGEYIPPQ